MNIWKRIKNLWNLLEIEIPQETPFVKEPSEKTKKWVEEIIKNNLPPRPATIVQEELPDNFEEDDTAN